MPLPYTIKRSRRKTLALHIIAGKLEVRSPWFVSKTRIEALIDEKKSWIEKHQKQQQRHAPKTYSPEEIASMKKVLAAYIEPRVQKIWSEHHLPKYTSIKITKSERRWGSCSAKNGLCFSYRLAEYLPTRTEFVDAIIVHELAHLREKNHQKPFWDLVYHMMENYESIMRKHRPC